MMDNATLIESEVIKAVQHDAEKQELHVLFHTTDWEYVYSGVSAELYARFLAAESKGKFFTAEIKYKMGCTRTDPTLPQEFRK